MFARKSNLRSSSGTFHSELVTTNKPLIGVVNFRRSHFEAAIEWVAGVPRAVLDRLDVYGVGDAAQAFDDSPETMKTAVSFA